MSTRFSRANTMQNLISLALFCLLVVVAVAFGGQFTGGGWYQTMNQPSWNPPAIVMTSVWALVYVMMAVSVWMVWCARRTLAVAAYALWGLQLALGVTWSWVYFGLHRPGWALAVMCLWLLAVLVVIRTFRRLASTASNLMLPTAAWLLFFVLLNFVQWRLNGGGLATIF